MRFGTSETEMNRGVRLIADPPTTLSLRPEGILKRDSRELPALSLAER